jgi:hypothetical protein
MKLRLGLIILLSLMVVTSCKKTVKFTKTSSYSGELTDFWTPLQLGKYVTYRLDSLNFYFYGQLDTITSYLAKDSIEDTITDGAGNLSYLVVRYLSDTTGANWTTNETYLVTPFTQNIQMVENNLRFIKLAWPIDNGFSWSGNSYLPYAPYQDFFDFSDDSHLTLGNWTYTYQNVDQPYTTPSGALNFDSTISVLQVNDSVNVPITNVNAFASRTYWLETYAKHIGLVYRHTEMWEYQPPTPDGTQSGYKIGFELTMSLVDHN